MLKSLQLRLLDAYCNVALMRFKALVYVESIIHKFA